MVVAHVGVLWLWGSGEVGLLVEDWSLPVLVARLLVGVGGLVVVLVVEPRQSVVRGEQEQEWE